MSKKLVDLFYFFKFFFAVSISAFVIRGIIYFNYFIFSGTPKISVDTSQTKFVFHHYFLGLFILLIGVFLRKKQFSIYLFYIGFGIILEEWTVLFENLGIYQPIRYFSGFDIPFGLLCVTLVYLIFYFTIRRDS